MCVCVCMSWLVKQCASMFSCVSRGQCMQRSMYLSVLVFDLLYKRMRDLETWVYGWDCCHFRYNPCMNRCTNGRGVQRHKNRMQTRRGRSSFYGKKMNSRGEYQYSQKSTSVYINLAHEVSPKSFRFVSYIHPSAQQLTAMHSNVSRKTCPSQLAVKQKLAVHRESP